MLKNLSILTFAISVLLTCGMSVQAQQYADILLLNGKIWTVNTKQPEAEAVACIGGKIVFVGSTKDAQAWVGKTTTMIDLKGRRVVPGFNDAHVHFMTGGENLASVQLRDTRSQAEFKQRIKDYTAKQPKGRWIRGGDWDHENWTPAALPTRQLLDDVTSDNPVFINRLDGHMALANTYALKKAGITKQTVSPPGGEIVHDASGEPTGILKDAAMNLVWKIVPPPDEAQMAEALKAAMKYAAEQGVTSVQDMSAGAAVLPVYQRLLRNGELTVRVYGCQPLAGWQAQSLVGVEAGFGNEFLKIGGLKGFADGSLGSTTALFYEPYLDAPSTAGLPADEMIPESNMQANITQADRAGLQICIHAIGDKANSRILDMYSEAMTRNNTHDRRFRIEHAQHLTKSDIQRFAKLGVVASMQPYHCIDDGRWAEKRIGAERAKGMYDFRSLLDAGAVLAFGSDWHVAPMEPLMGIYAAVTRRTLDEKNPKGWIPQEKITVAEAVQAFTLGSAFASFDERSKGSIEVGKLADIAVLSDDIFTISPEAIRTTRVTLTIFNGKIIFERK